VVALKRVQQDKKYKTRELEIIKMLENPFIIKVLGTFVTDEGKYEWLNIAMEAYHQNFFELMRLHPVAGLEAKLYVYQMLRGLNYLHSRGVCHRDLKPQNMLVRGRRLVICDFGSAKVLAAGEQNISYICSRCYRAPELIFESTGYSTQIDMWSLGCILLEMLHGRPLFIADSSLNHILEVIKVLGTPTREEVRAMNPTYELNDYDLPKIKGRPFRKVAFPS
jgi:serine/threonine protein kinase